MVDTGLKEMNGVTPRGHDRLLMELKKKVVKTLNNEDGCFTLVDGDAGRGSGRLELGVDRDMWRRNSTGKCPGKSHSGVRKPSGSGNQKCHSETSSNINMSERVEYVNTPNVRSYFKVPPNNKTERDQTNLPSQSDSTIYTFGPLPNPPSSTVGCTPLSVTKLFNTLRFASTKFVSAFRSLRTRIKADAAVTNSPQASNLSHPIGSSFLPRDLSEAGITTVGGRYVISSELLKELLSSSSDNARGCGDAFIRSDTTPSAPPLHML